MIGTKLNALLAVITAALAVAVPATAQTAPPAPVQSTQPARPALPVIGTILEHRAALGLSASQVEALERLGLDFIREAIRRQADLQIAQIDLDVVLDPEAGQTVDVKAAEAKVREVERIRTDLQLALIRAVEAGRAQLTAEQRSKLSALLAGTATPGGADPVDDPPNPGRGTGHAPPGATGHAPGGSRPAPGGVGHAPPSGGGHVPPGGGVHPRPPAPRPDGRRDFGRRDHDRVIIRGWSTFWWEPYWFYAPPPVYVYPPTQAYWYYCPSAQAYYPYVSTCPEPWVRVPALPQ
jgi:hypothetical protein